MGREVIAGGDVADAHEGAALAERLRRCRDEILLRWERDLRAAPVARPFDRPTLRDDVPLLLDRLAEQAPRIDRGAPPAELEREARDHAILRLGMGFDLGQVALEYATLRRCILDALSCDGGPLAAPAVRFVNDGVDGALALAIEVYGGARLRTLEALDRIGEVAFADAATFDELPDRIARVFRDASPAIDTVAILLREGDHLRVRAAIGLEEAVATRFSMRIGEGFAGRIAATGRPLALRSAQDDPLVLNEVLRKRGVRALYGVPLMVRGEVLGVLHVGSCTAFELSSEERTLVDAVAARAAAALAQAQVIRRERAADAAARALGPAETLDEGIDRLLTALCKDLGWEVASYWQLDADTALRYRSGHAAAGVDASAFVEASRHLVLRGGRGLPGRAVASGRPEWISDFAADLDFIRAGAAAQVGLRTGLAFPLRAGERTLGAVELLARARRSPVEEPVELTRVIATHLGELVERIVAREQVRESEALKAAILRSAVDAVIGVAADGRVTMWNAAAERTFGYRAEEALGGSLLELISPPRLHDEHGRCIARLLAGEESEDDHHVETHAIRKDGTELPVDVTVARVPLPGPPMLTGIVRDLSERKTAEDALRRSKREADEARALVDVLLMKAPVGLAFLDLELRYVRVNEQMAIINGAAVDWHVGRHVAEVLRGEVGQKVLPVLRDVVATGRAVIDRPVRAPAPADAEEPRWWVMSVYPVPGSGERWAGVGVVVVDVTARRQAEDDLRFLAEAGQLLASSLDYGTTLERVTELIVPQLADWCVVDVVEDGGSLSEPVAAAHADAPKTAIVRELRRRYGAARGSVVEAVLETGQTRIDPEISDPRLRAMARDEEHLALLRAVGLRSAIVVPLRVGGRITGALTLASATPARRFREHDRAKAEELARRSALAIENARLFERASRAAEERERALALARDTAARLQSVLDNAPAAVFIKDREGRYTFANRRFAESMRVDLAAVRCKTDLELFPLARRADVDAVRANDRRVLESGEALEIEELVPVDHEPRTWLAIKFPLVDASGAPYAVCGIATDITERKQLDQTRDIFLGILGHDLRTPLSAISIGAQLLIQHEALPRELRSIAVRIRSSCERMRRMVDDLLDLTRGRLGSGIPITRRRADAGAIASAAIAELRLAYPGRDVRLEVTGDVSGDWDAERLAQVDSNLVSNALQYAAPGAPIQVFLEGRASEVVMAVQNPAQCPPARELGRLFDPFRRGARSRDAREGLGLGLYITREIVRAHGGFIDASCSDTGGFRVTVTLPRAGK